MNRDISFRDRSLSEFLELLATDKPPLPAAGSALALVGALASALTRFVVRLSFSNGSVEKGDPKVEALLEEISEFQRQNLDMMDQDVDAYNHLMETMRQSKDGQSEKPDRNEALENAYVFSVKPPMKLVKMCIRLLGILGAVRQNIPEAALADLAAAMDLANICFSDSLLIARINLRGIKNNEIAEPYRQQVEAFQRQGERLYDEHRRALLDRDSHRGGVPSIDM